MSLFTVNGELSIDTSNVYVDGQKIDLTIQKIAYKDYIELVKPSMMTSSSSSS